MTDNLTRIEELSPAKRALFDVLLKEKKVPAGGPDPAVLPTIVPDREGRYHPFPLTDSQQSFFVGRSGAVELGLATHMYEEFESTDLDLERLGLAWSQLVERHDVLRMIVLKDGQQQILQHVPPYSIMVTDVRQRNPEEVSAHLEDIRERMLQEERPTDRWPLFQLHATRLGDRHYRIHCSIDGLLLDGWSYQNLFREWLDRYQDTDAPVVPCDISFRDYVLAEISLRDSEAYRNAVAYWRDRLPELPEAPQLPLACRPEELARPRFGRRKSSLTVNQWERLKTNGKERELSWSAILLAAYAEVLTTWSRSPRFTLSVPRFNRLPLHPQVNELLGEFASFTLLEVDNASPGAFEERARRLQQQHWRDLDYQQMSGVQVLRELNRSEGRSDRALMPVVLTVMPQKPVALTQEQRSVYQIMPTAQLWLDCQIEESEEGALVFNWDSVDELFPAGLLDDMFAAFCALLHRLADDERTWQEERPQLLPQAQLDRRRDSNATDARMEFELLQELFAKQADQRPQHPAVKHSGGVVTYGELTTRTQELGRRLRGNGVRPNGLVAVVMEKGPEQVVATLATLFAGGAYLPIDPALPQERLQYLLEHGQVTIALTQSWIDTELSWPPHVERICVDKMEVDVAHQIDVEPLESPQTPDDLAYVIYTSGSTGLPKGVMVGHRGVVNAILDTNRSFAVEPEDRVFALTALHHDMSVYDIFGTLAAGGTIVMPDPGSIRDPSKWQEQIAEEGVTIWNSVPTLMEMFVEYVAGQQRALPSSLRVAFLGGDWIPVTLPSRIAALTEHLQVVSVGGPTETTLWNIWYPIEQMDPTWRSIPYGRPIANTQYYVLNDLGQHCPDWVPGVLHCAGVGLAKGYWRDEEKTRAGFPDHPQIGKRLYRTGDLGRFRPDGTIEFLGREDLQVQVQGNRIELGEIESALAQHDLVNTAVVTFNSEGMGNGYLTAHVRLEKPSPESSASLGDFIDTTDPNELEGLLLDPASRIEFKLREHGLRRFEPHQSSVQLFTPPVDDSVLGAYAARRSYRTFQASPISFQVFGELLSCLRQVIFDGAPVPKYLYPSGGGLYPVQTYLYVKPDGVEGLSPGTYYYSPKEHRLIPLQESAVVDRSIHIESNQPMFDESAFSLYFLADLESIAPMYGTRARDFCLLEAGYMGQVLMQAGVPLRIGLCPVATFRFDLIRPAFKLEDSHIVLQGMIGGTLLEAQVQPAGFVNEVSALSSAGGFAHRGERQNEIVDQLKEFLKRKLPEHMVPSRFTVRESFPITRNGKIDRQTLGKEIDTTATSPEPSDTSPRTDLERQISDIWSSVLNAEKLGTHQTFFELGGNSLQLVQIHAILEDTLGRQIKVVDLFQYPTIATLAERLGGTGDDTRSLDETYSRGQMRAKSQQSEGESDNDDASED